MRVNHIPLRNNEASLFTSSQCLGFITDGSIHICWFFFFHFRHFITFIVNVTLRFSIFCHYLNVRWMWGCRGIGYNPDNMNFTYSLVSSQGVHYWPNWYMPLCPLVEQGCPNVLNKHLKNLGYLFFWCIALYIRWTHVYIWLLINSWVQVQTKPKVPTQAVCAEHLELRKEVLTMLNLKKQVFLFVIIVLTTPSKL